METSNVRTSAISSGCYLFARLSGGQWSRDHFEELRTGKDPAGSVCAGARGIIGQFEHCEIVALLREQVYSGMAPQIFQLGPFVIHIDVKEFGGISVAATDWNAVPTFPEFIKGTVRLNCAACLGR
jgi:hypothetical protein